MISATSFPSGAAYLSAFGAFAVDTLGAVRLRFLVLDVPTSASFRWIAGFTAAAANGWLVWTNTSGLGESVGEIQVYIAIDGVLTRVARKFILPEMVGQVVTLHIVLRSLRVRIYVDGQEIGDGAVTSGLGVAYTTYNKGSGIFGIGSDSSLTVPCEQAIVECVTGSTSLTDAQVLADARLPIGAQMVGEAHHWVSTAQNVANGSDLTDTVGSATLTKNGSPARSGYNPANALPIRATLNMYGDSTLAGYLNSTGLTGPGHRRAMQKQLQSLGCGVSIIGFSAPQDGPFDYDIWSNGSNGQALVTELGSFAADLANSGGALTCVWFTYGLNDAIAQNRTAAQFYGDCSTAAGLVASARPGVVCGFDCPWDVGTANATSAQHTVLRQMNAEFWGAIASIQAANPTIIVAGFDASQYITDPNDTAQLEDGVHPTTSMYNTLGVAKASAVSRALWRFR